MNPTYRVLFILDGGGSFQVVLDGGTAERLLADWRAYRRALSAPRDVAASWEAYPPHPAAPNGKWEILWGKVVGMDVSPIQLPPPGLVPPPAPGVGQPWRGGGSGWPN